MNRFCNAKATHIFSAKNINVFAIFQDRNFNVMLANNFVLIKISNIFIIFLQKIRMDTKVLVLVCMDVRVKLSFG